MSTTAETPEQQAMLLEILAELTLTNPQHAREQLQAMSLPRHYPHLWDALMAASLWNSRQQGGAQP